MSSQVEPDLPPGLECLKNVDTLLRCPICFDFLNIAMMTKCSHNFCSLCIRKFLCYKLQCPLCNTPITEQDLRNNRLLDDVVVIFQAARRQLSNVHFDTPPISPKSPASAVHCKTARDRAQKSNATILSQFFQKRPKTQTPRDASTSRCSERGEGKPSLTPHSSDIDPGCGPAAVKQEPPDAEETSVQQRLMPVKQEVMGSHAVSSKVKTEQSSPSPQDVKPVIKVDCPVCSVGVSQEFINKHLDMCLGRGEKKESLRSSLGKTRHPMAKLVYNLLSLQELKRRLRECHLSVQGSRDQLIKRHQEFLHIYNAQCDALKPKSAEEIAKEVEANEKIRNGLKGKSKPVMVFTKNHTEQEIDEIHSNYRKQHSNDFSRLIAQVRGRLVTTRQTGVAQEVIVNGEDEEPTASTDQEAVEGLKVRDTEGGEEPSTGAFDLTASPTHSDVSISSSISDVFGPDPVSNHDNEESASNPVPKRASSSREQDPDWSTARGKRRRKK